LTELHNRNQHTFFLLGIERSTEIKMLSIICTVSHFVFNLRTSIILKIQMPYLSIKKLSIIYAVCPKNSCCETKVCCEITNFTFGNRDNNKRMGYLIIMKLQPFLTKSQSTNEQDLPETILTCVTS
jgi:hypothetical protein